MKKIKGGYQEGYWRIRTKGDVKININIPLAALPRYEG